MVRPAPDPAPPAPEALFHPAVAAWLRRRFGAPTPVQARAWAVTARRGHALVAAPTGSGKTLAAFLWAIDELVVDGLAHGLPDEVRVLYVSPLKALSNDVRKNLEEPLAGIRAELAQRGLADPGIRTAVRSGDTPAGERERMRRRPPHILVTTPESLFILLTAEGGRAMLKSVRSVIVDELHALAGNKRGAHLMLSLERLAALGPEAPVRIGLSATVRPLEGVARYLVGARDEAVAVIDAGHVRARDLALEMPRAPLEAVMSTEVWGELYDRLASLVAEHRTTLVFVNQRRLAERAARALAERLGTEHVAAHHGSLAREHRLDAEQRLKVGTLKALVATSSLELGIDIGDVDLVCQLGSPRSVNAFVQRVGRSGHAVGATPKGRLFPLALDDLLECTALLDAVARGELDRVRVPEHPLDVLAQQLVAEVACREWPVDALYALCRRAAPYRELSRADFDAVLWMLAEGFSTRRGRRAAWLHHDAVNGLVRARRGARLAAVTNAGVIPDQFDYDVVLLPEAQRIGSLNEDFAFESLVGDIFQLGNRSYRIARIETGKVLVEDAQGQPPSMPFWFGESPGRSDELSHAVARLTAAASAWLDEGVEACRRHLAGELHLGEAAARQLADYLGGAKGALGVLPGEDCVVFERFFDEVGDTHLVIHSPFGSRINRAWGLALRKRLCRQFNFELQASALEDSIVLSLGPTHSFDLAEPARWLRPATARQVLVQALIAAPMFGTRWRWVASAALAVLRRQGGHRLPPPFQRSAAEDLLTVVFPDQVACAENLAGEREVPEHPLVEQTVADCLHETMDVDGFLRLLARLESGALRVVARDLTAPSPLALAILNARPYAFLDGGAGEERRTRAVRGGLPLDAADAAALAVIDPAAIERVRAEAWPEPESPDELHDAIVVHGFLTLADAGTAHLAPLEAAGRATRWQAAGGETLLVAAERLHEFLALAPAARFEPAIRALHPTPADAGEALREILRGRLELLGPASAAALAAPLGLDPAAVDAALRAPQAEGAVMHGSFSAADADEWCDRRLLARIHRLSRDSRRAEVRPVAPAQFMRFLFRWHQLAGADGGADERRRGEGGLVAALSQLEGFATAAAAWEEDLLPARLRDYEPAALDKLCASGRFVWWRPARGGDEAAPAARTLRSTPILLCERAVLAHWQRAGGAPGGADTGGASNAGGAGGTGGMGGTSGAAADPSPSLSSRARRLLEALHRHGASFFADLQMQTRLLGVELEAALAEGVAQGLVTCDSFAGLRALVMPAEKRRRLQRRPAASRPSPFDEAGRWSLARRVPAPGEDVGALAEPHVEHVARVLLRRYGVVFRALLEREDGLPPWRDLHYVLRRLEARGEIGGGRFVTGFAGEQFALPEAAALLRRIAREGDSGAAERVSISAADPLNLAGIVTPGEKLPRLAGNRLLYEAGVPVAVQSGGAVRYLAPLEAAAQWEAKKLLIRGARAFAAAA